MARLETPVRVTDAAYWHDGDGVAAFFRAKYLGEYPGKRLMYFLLTVAIFGLAWQSVEESITGAALTGGLSASLGMSSTEESWMLVAATLAMVAIYPISGPITDRMGRKRAIVYGLIGFIICDLVKAFSTDYAMFVVGRVIEGVLVMFTVPPTLALVRDFTPRLSRGVGYGLVAAGGWGLGVLLSDWLSSPILGAAKNLSLFGLTGSWRWLYVFYALIAALGALVEGLFLKDLPLMLRVRRRGLDVSSEDEALAAERDDRGSVMLAIKSYLSQPRMWVIYSNQWFWGMCWTGILTFMPIIIVSTMGTSAATATFLSGFVWVAYAVSAFALGIFTDVYHVRKTVNIVGMLGVAVTVAFFATQVLYTHASFTELIIVFLLIGAFAGAQYPSFAICVAGESERINPSGVASSFAFYWITAQLVSIIPQYLFPVFGGHSGGWRTAMLLMAAGALLSAPTLIAAHGPYKPRRHLPKEMEDSYY
jgi:MFS family permease